MKYEEITSENSFWKLFKLTWQIPAAKDTKYAFFLFLTVLLSYYWFSKERLVSVEALILNVAEGIVSATISLIGFIFAAYIVFANLADRKLMHLMATNKHPKYNMSFLKYGHCNFIKIMFDLLIIVFLTYIGIIFVPTLPKFNDIDSNSLRLLYIFILAMYQSFYILIIMLCKSAIFNVYNSIMVGVRFYAEEQENK
tara:strand:+ start:49 stop:639 length:591 start_codon:yes stop_codon:yes gene_type:complete